MKTKSFERSTSHAASTGRLIGPAAFVSACTLLVLLAAGCPPGGVPGPDNTNDNSNTTPTTNKFELWSTGVHLRGANIYQRRVYPMDGQDFLGPGPVGPPYSQASLEGLAALGANYVNLSHPGLFTETPPYQLDAGVQTNLDRLIDMAEAADLFVVISFRTGPGRSEFAIFEGQDWFPPELVINEVWSSQAAQDSWVEMWRYAAERYRGRNVVVGYDLMVEPNGASTIFGIFDPAEFYPDHQGSLVDWNQFHPRISAAIREVDGDTPILTSGMGYGSIYWLGYLQPSGDERTVYTVHHYEPSAYTNQAPADGIAYPGQIETGNGPEQVDRAWLDALLAPIDEFKAATGAPVAINEFGVMRWCPGAAEYITDQVDVFESRGVNHALWLWESSHPPQAEFDDFNFRHGPDPLNHEDVATSTLIEAIQAAWSRNTDRPNSSAP